MAQRNEAEMKKIVEEMFHRRCNPEVAAREISTKIGENVSMVTVRRWFGYLARQNLAKRQELLRKEAKVNNEELFKIISVSVQT